MRLSSVLWIAGALLFVPTISSAQQSLPAPWRTADVGDVGTAGSAYQGPDGDLYVAGAGSDIYGNADSFRYVYQFVEDGSITALVGSEQNTNPSAKTGVMIRLNLQPDSPHVILDVEPDGTIEFMTRRYWGGRTAWVAGSTVRATPESDDYVGIYVVLKLIRSNGIVTAVVCAQGQCQTIGSTPFPSELGLIGVAVTSHDPTILNHAYFPAAMPTVTTVPDPWSSVDVGAVGTRGQAYFQDNMFQVGGGGSDIWGTADSFHGVFRGLNGNGTIAARVLTEQDTNYYAKASVMVRDCSYSQEGAATALLDVLPNGTLEFLARPSYGASMFAVAYSSASYPVWLRLDRSGNQVTAFSSSDGNAWQTIGTTQVAFQACGPASSVTAALAVTSHDVTRFNTAYFDNVSVTTASSATNLLVNGGFEGYTPPALGLPGWVSDTDRQTPAVSDSSQPHSGSNDGLCATDASHDCGIYQDVIAPATGTYTVTFYANADHTGGLIGVDVNRANVAYNNVGVRGVGNYGGAYTMTFSANKDDTIHVWMYAPAAAGYVVIDDVVLLPPS